MPSAIAAFSTSTFPTKPASGGIPARDSSDSVSGLPPDQRLHGNPLTSGVAGRARRRAPQGGTRGGGDPACPSLPNLARRHVVAGVPPMRGTRSTRSRDRAFRQQHSPPGRGLTTSACFGGVDVWRRRPAVRHRGSRLPSSRSDIASQSGSRLSFARAASFAARKRSTRARFVGSSAFSSRTSRAEPAAQRSPLRCHPTGGWSEGRRQLDGARP